MKLYTLIAARNALTFIYKSNVTFRLKTLSKIRQFLEDTEEAAEHFRTEGNKILARFQDSEGKIPKEAILVADNAMRAGVGNEEIDIKPIFTEAEFDNVMMRGDDYEALLPIIAQSDK